MLVAVEWFNKYYPDHDCIRVCVHPKNIATKAAVAGATHALTYEKIAELISDSRSLLLKLCESQLDKENLELECNRLLSASSVKSDRIPQKYLMKFEELDSEK